jgi:uncharacterized protein involved in exopolysaccharide biosynthesis
MLVRITAISLLIGLRISFSIPKQYKSSTSIMPPDEHGSSAMMLAALAGRIGSLGGLGGLADGLPSGHTNSDLFIFLLRSTTVSGDLIDRFNLQHIYHNRYRVDTAKHLAHLTKITEDKKSGVITIEVVDTNRERARDLAQGYLDELNQLVMRTNTSAAHRERVFIEQRLHSVQADLEDAEMKLSQFSSNNTAIDIKEQTHAMVDAGAQVQAELIVEQSGLESLRQIYGDGNMRVRESEARIASLQAQLARMTGSSSSTSGGELRKAALNSGDSNEKAEMYPPLRQLPRLGVPYADLSRRVRVQETVFELLTQQYETARIEEAKDVPAVNVIDPPGLPEKKSFPPRLLLTLFLTFLSCACTSSLILACHYWSATAKDDPRKEFFSEVFAVLRRRIFFIHPFRGGAPSEGI